MPVLVFEIAAGWATLLLLLGGLGLLRTGGTLQRILVLDVLVILVIALLATLSYARGVSYYIDAALGVALLSLASTLVACRYVIRGGPF